MREIVFWSAFGAVVLGVVYTLIQNHRRRKFWEQKEAELREHAIAEFAPPPPHAEADADAPRKRRERPPAPGAREAHGAGHAAPAFDPSATRIYAKPADSSQHTDRMQRAQAQLPVGARARLICVGGYQKGHMFEIPPQGLSIGRADDNDVIIHDGRVSSHHAWLGILHGKAVLKDYQSLNGTFLNADLHDPIGEAVLVSGDTIFFGGHGGEQYRFIVD